MKQRGGARPRAGRKSAYQELKNARDALSMFFDQQDQEELESKIRSGKFSIADRYKLTAMKGDAKILSNLANKALPDKVELHTNLTISQVLDQLEHGQTIDGQAVEIESPLQDPQQNGETDSIQTESAPIGLPPA